MRQNSILKKMNSYLCVIDTLKIRTRFLIMHHTIASCKSASARSVYTRVIAGTYVHVRKNKVSYHIQKVPQVLKWPLLQLTTSTYIGSSAAYVVTMYTSGSGTRPLAKSWELLASGTTRTIATLWQCTVQRIGKGASLGEL